jgi:diguanylate cyclase (GGDEF)-like protein
LSLKIAVIGANPANVEEIEAVVTATLGCGIELVTATIDNYRTLASADLYVCLINRQQQMETAFGVDNVVAMKFIPPTKYFLQLCQMPAGTPVLIFNNSTAGTHVLMQCLHDYGLTHLRYEIVPYDEMDPIEVGKKIAAASLITGGISYVGKGRALYEKFGSYLSPKTQVLVSPPRIATSESISRLCHAFSRLYHQSVTDELIRLASIDYLTQLPNRRTFDERLCTEWNRARRENRTLSLAMLDIDFFKNYNDHYGHTAGDQCLQLIALAMKSAIRRPADFCARYGGEEFALILPETESNGARIVLEEIRQAVLNLGIDHEFSSIAPQLTISAGYSTTNPSGALTAHDFLRMADKALYQAKYQGRNKTVAFSVPELSDKLLCH